MHIFETKDFKDEQPDRIRLDMTVIGIAVALAEGNPGALRVCLDLFNKGAAHDPDSALEGVDSLLSLDSLRVYGPRIWLLYKAVCGEDLGTTVAVLRAVQLGIISSAELSNAIDNQGQGFALEETLGKVLEKLPGFRLKVG